MYEVKAPIFLDELREFAIRDPERLVPGSRVVLGHVPTLERPDLEDHRQSAYGQIVTVLEVGWKAFAELHPGLSDPFKSGPALVMVYDDGSESKLIRYQHLSDSGVVPYSGGWRNPVNFVVLIEDLEAHGIEPLLTVSEDYELALEQFNEQVHELPYFYDDCY